MIDSTAAGQGVAVFGAAGHTGRFVVRELERRGLGAVRIGRSLQALAQAGPHPHAPARAASVDDPASLHAALAGATAVINCAGPFFDTALPLIDAALRAGIPYVDVAPEQAVVQSVFDLRHEAALAAGVPVVPAAAFYGGLADLLASALLGADGRADEVTIAVGLDRWHPTRGTRLTGARNTAPRVIREAGRTAPLPAPAPTREWDFPPPIGRREVVMQPFSEIVTLASHLDVQTIHPWINIEALQDIRDATTPPPAAVDAAGRSAQRFAMEVIVTHDGQQRRATAAGRDIYYVSAPIAVEAAARLIDGRAMHAAGVHAPGAIFDARAFLAALGPDVLDVGYDLPTRQPQESFHHVE